ncbi:MAG: hypothetical protein BWX55_01204 [Deltaproteobacteria bacterium ADurb.Bin022]|nr:MAG: hypothetical protein BWX55_01204 [Deltaproteobacteria bacterium ADurb.Bin022]
MRSKRLRNISGDFPKQNQHENSCFHHIARNGKCHHINGQNSINNARISERDI